MTKLTLKLRFTLMTILIMSITCIILVVSINLDIKYSVPEFISIVDQTTQSPSLGQLEGEFSIQAPESGVISGSIIASELITQTVSKIYMGSLLTLLITLGLGGICSYFIADKALKPLQLLSTNIKTINEHQLNQQLPIQGPNDEIKELTTSFNQLLSKLNKAFISQKRFNANLTHELKTPLAIIKTNIDVLSDQSHIGQKEYRETLDLIDKSVQKMNLIIETLFDLMQNENAPLEDEIDIVTLLNDVIEDLTPLASQQQIILMIPSKPVTTQIKGNEILIYQAFYNLIENAIKYNKPNGTVEITYERLKEQLKIQISDSGIGIPAESLHHLFEPFYRVDKYDVHAKKSLGLGLALTLATIKHHHGEIQIESEEKKGTKITILLPLSLNA